MKNQTFCERNQKTSYLEKLTLRSVYQKSMHAKLFTHVHVMAVHRPSTDRPHVQIH